MSTRSIRNLRSISFTRKERGERIGEFVQKRSSKPTEEDQQYDTSEQNMEPFSEKQIQMDITYPRLDEDLQIVNLNEESPPTNHRSDSTKLSGGKIKEDSSSVCSSNLNVREQFVRKHPLIYGAFVHFLIPFFALIGVCFFFGYILAFWESNGTYGLSRPERLDGTPNGEKVANDQALAELRLRYRDLINDNVTAKNQIIDVAASCSDLALKEVLAISEDTGSPVNTTTFGELVNSCSTIEANSMFQTTSYTIFVMQENLFDLPFFGVSESPLTFDWTTCPDAPEMVPIRWLNHARHVFESWMKSFEYLYRQNMMNGMSDIEAYDNAVLSATGHQNCTAYSPGGAIYWFSIMTTVGYGTRVLSSNNSRILVCTAGMASILLFAALLRMSGGYFNLLYDHFMNIINPNISESKERMLSLIFWFCMIWIAMIAGAYIFVLQTALSVGTSFNRVLEEVPFEDGFWFQFLSFTTVGLGDYNIPSYGASSSTMFIVPVVQLLGFITITVFIERVSLIGQDNDLTSIDDLPYCQDKKQNCEESCGLSKVDDI